MANHTIGGVIEINTGGGNKGEPTPPAAPVPTPPAQAGNDPIRFVFETKNYSDQRGARIEHRIVVSGVAPKEFVSFVGRAAVRMETPDGVHTEEFNFPVYGATTLEEAFGRFEGALREGAEAFKKRKMAEMHSHSNRLIIPGANMPPLPPAPNKLIQP